MIDLRQETDALALWPTGERLRALQCIIPRAQVEAVLAQTDHDRVVCTRLPRGSSWCVLHHRPGSVLSGLLPPILPLAATLSPRRRVRPLDLVRGAPAVVGWAACLPTPQTDGFRYALPILPGYWNQPFQSGKNSTLFSKSSLSPAVAIISKSRIPAPIETRS